MSGVMTRVKVFLILLGLTAVGTLLGVYNLDYLSWVTVPSWNHLSNVLFVKSPSSPSHPPSHPLSPVIVFPTNKTNSTHLCSCEKCLTEDEGLLKDRLDTFHQPLLSKDYKLSEDDYNWWRRLQFKSSSFSTYESTVERLFQFFPPVPDVTEPQLNRCRTCAVVGNSQNMIGANYGQIIDSQDVVIRINRGPTKGFEKDVGWRITHRALYPESAGNVPDPIHILFFAFKMMDLRWILEAFTTGFSGSSYAPIISRINANKSLVMVVNPSFMRYVHDKWLSKKNQYPSTGIMTVVLAMHMCDEVHVFGFGADSSGHWSHYWEPPIQTKVNGVHPGSLEYSIIQQLDKEGKVKFYKGV